MIGIGWNGISGQTSKVKVCECKWARVIHPFSFAAFIYKQYSYFPVSWSSITIFSSEFAKSLISPTSLSFLLSWISSPCGNVKWTKRVALRLDTFPIHLLAKSRFWKHGETYPISYLLEISLINAFSLSKIYASQSHLLDQDQLWFLSVQVSDNKCLLQESQIPPLIY